MSAGRVFTDVAEPAIQGDDHPILFPGRCSNLSISGSDEALLRRYPAVVTELVQDSNDRGGKVLVELESHSAGGDGVRISSRARSAAYEIAARMASEVSVGYSSRISVSLIPAARQSRTTLTGIRVPRMRACP